MKKRFITICLLAVGLVSVADAKKELSRQDADRQLQRMTLEEKIGQMMQLVTDIFGTNDTQGVFHIDRAKADT